MLIRSELEPSEKEQWILDQLGLHEGEKTTVLILAELDAKTVTDSLKDFINMSIENDLDNRSYTQTERANHISKTEHLKLERIWKKDTDEEGASIPDILKSIGFSSSRASVIAKFAEIEGYTLEMYCRWMVTDQLQFQLLNDYHPGLIYYLEKMFRPLLQQVPPSGTNCVLKSA